MNTIEQTIDVFEQRISTTGDDNRGVNLQAAAELVGRLAEDLGDVVADGELKTEALAFRCVGRLIQRYNKRKEGDAVLFQGGYTITVHNL